MVPERMRTLSTFVGLMFGVGVVCPTPLPAQNCQIVIDAMTKVVTTPSHLYTTMTGSSTGGKPHITEIIYTGGASYVNTGVNGPGARSRRNRY
jgi:hypothetical protein